MGTNLIIYGVLFGFKHRLGLNDCVYWLNQYFCGFWLYFSTDKQRDN